MNQRERGTTWKWILSIFKFRNGCYKQLEEKKQMKSGVTCLVSMFLSSVMVLKLSTKECIFWNFVLTSASILSLLRQFTYMYHLLFPLWLFLTFIFIFESSQNLFSCGLSIGPSWSVKYLNFGHKLPIRTAHNTFLEIRHPEITKNPYYILSPRGEPKKYHLRN